jgi:hypothetical protein
MVLIAIQQHTLTSYLGSGEYSKEVKDMMITNEILKNGIWIKDLELEDRGYESEWEFRTDAYIQNDTIMLAGDCMCSVSDYGNGWTFKRPSSN